MTLDEKVDSLCSEFSGLRKEVTDSKRTAPEGNGTRKIVAGVIAGILVAALGAGTTMMINHGSRLAVAEAKAEDAVPVSRVAVVETKVDAVEKRLGTIEADGKASNSKLDALLGRFNVRVPE